jgi:hypothetical protein
MWFLLLALFLAAPALAQDDAVVVTSVRDPAKKSYRRMLEGAKLFEERKALAPDAALRFRLVPRKGNVQMDGVALEVGATQMEVARDHTFTIEHDRAALAEDAKVMSNRKAGTITWRADVRTPGLPDNVRRLGDLRLECEVGMKAGLISNYPKGFFGWLEETFGNGPDYCRRPAPRYVFLAERPLFSVALVHGERRETLPLDLLYAGAARDRDWKKDKFCDCEALFDRAYFVPLGDASWPDDTRVELDYLEGSHLAEKLVKEQFGPLGEATVLDFPSGYEVWVYPALALAFDRSGALAKTRLR